MRKLTNLVVGALVWGAVAVSAGASGPAMAAEGKAAIDMRSKFMKKEMLGPFKVLKNFAKEGKGTTANVASQAAKLSAAAMKIPRDRSEVVTQQKLECQLLRVPTYISCRSGSHGASSAASGTMRVPSSLTSNIGPPTSSWSGRATA